MLSSESIEFPILRVRGSYSLFVSPQVILCGGLDVRMASIFFGIKKVDCCGELR